MGMSDTMINFHQELMSELEKKYSELEKKLEKKYEKLKGDLVCEDFCKKNVYSNPNYTPPNLQDDLNKIDEMLCDKDIHLSVYRSILIKLKCLPGLNFGICSIRSKCFGKNVWENDPFTHIAEWLSFKSKDLSDISLKKIINSLIYLYEKDYIFVSVSRKEEGTSNYLECELRAKYL